ncbi:hypothetical protein [Caballeronia sp. GACF4]|jgi:hypothetical protein|uniref:hypothetical protein n=1 Tax=Caballeronia sp. GACF4 TaxID=2921763 RepID=UPI002028BA31|nr:hypothetical protein [Caballeronia sp. GACF4]
MHERIEFQAVDISAQDSPSLPVWEALMRQAIKAAAEQQTTAARSTFEHALEIARRLIEAPPPGRGEDCIAALVVSHHNLADHYAEQGNQDAAAQLRCEAHEALLALSVSAERPVTIRQAALRHSRETHVALIRHVARHGPHSLIARTIENASLALSASGPARH